MAEKTFRSPGFFDYEIDLASESTTNAAVPLGVIGASEYGPAFVPVYVGRGPNSNLLQNYGNVFGGLDPLKFGPYAVKAWFDNGGQSVTYLRVLGAGANTTANHLTLTRETGLVNNAGFQIGPWDLSSDGNGETAEGKINVEGNASGGEYVGGIPGTAIFLAGRHSVPANADYGYPIFTDNDSFPGVKEAGSASADNINLIRAKIFMSSGSMFQIASLEENQAEDYYIKNGPSWASSSAGVNYDKRFCLVLSSSSGANLPGANHGTYAHYKIFTCSLDPSDKYYISKVLNTNPKNFQKEEHLLYLDYEVDDRVATVVAEGGKGVEGNRNVALLSGSNGASGAAYLGTEGSRFLNIFGRYDTRYKTPRTSAIISQPYGSKEWDLFHFETLSDGEAMNERFKVSIANIKASTDPEYTYGTFDVQVRRFEDEDASPQIIERFLGCNLDPDSDRFVGKQVGDKKTSYYWDALTVDERRLVYGGKYPNKSMFVRIVMNSEVYDKNIPASAIPFGFRGIPVLKTSPRLSYNPIDNNDDAGTELASAGSPRMYIAGVASDFSGSLVPPLPMRFKCTAGSIATSDIEFIGHPGLSENHKQNFYWGVQYHVIAPSDENGSVLNPNANGQRVNGIVKSYAKFQGLPKMDQIYTGSAIDSFNNNKFTLAKVALRQGLSGGTISGLTGSANAHIRETAYIRNGSPASPYYTVYDVTSQTNRATFATLLRESAVKFNRFSGYMKFNTMFYGGYDGLNILDPDVSLLNDMASSTDGGKASGGSTGGLGLVGTNTSDSNYMMGANDKNNVINSYRVAARIMTDLYKSRHHIITTPGIRDPYVTDFVSTKIKENYQMAIYVMDIPNYAADGTTRLFINSSTRPDITQTSEVFEGRNLDNNYVATYFPDVYYNDSISNRTLLVPASIAAISALSFSDANSPGAWYAPAGFNRGSLSDVSNLKVRLTSGERDTLYDARINPIANFPNEGFVIFGQKTLQRAKSALDRVNVRRLLLEVKRQVINISKSLLFEQNTPALRKRFIKLVAPRLQAIQAAAGIENFKIIMDESNNTATDANNYTLNGTIMIVPTRSIEFIAVDFVIDRDGVSFS